MASVLDRICKKLQQNQLEKEKPPVEGQNSPIPSVPNQTVDEQSNDANTAQGAQVVLGVQEVQGAKGAESGTNPPQGTQEAQRTLGTSTDRDAKVAQEAERTQGVQAAQGTPTDQEVHGAQSSPLINGEPDRDQQRQIDEILEKSKNSSSRKRKNFQPKSVKTAVAEESAPNCEKNVKNLAPLAPGGTKFERKIEIRSDSETSRDSFGEKDDELTNLTKFAALQSPIAGGNFQSESPSPELPPEGYIQRFFGAECHQAVCLESPKEHYHCKICSFKV